MYKLLIPIFTAIILTLTVSAEDGTECIFCDIGLECMSTYRLICNCTGEECREECGICPQLLSNGYPCRQGLYIKCICESEEECYALAVSTPLPPSSSSEELTSSSETLLEDREPINNIEIFNEDFFIQAEPSSSSETVDEQFEPNSSSEITDIVFEEETSTESSSEQLSIGSSDGQLSIGSSDGQLSIGSSDAESMTPEQIEKSMQDLKEVRQLLQGILWFATFIFSVVICWLVVRQLYKFIN